MRCCSWLLLCLLGCGADPQLPGVTDGPDGGAAPAPNATPPDATPPDAARPPTAAQLSPRFTVLDHGHSVNEVLVAFAVPTRSAWRPLDGTRLRLEPEAPARLKYLDPSTLSLKTPQPLHPGTRYTVRLESVATTHGVVAPTTPWTHTFDTPPFQLLRIEPHHANFGEGIAEVDAVFSAPVHAKTLTDFATWSVAGRSVKAAPAYRPGSDRNRARITLTSDAVQPNAEVELTLAPGLPYDDQRKAAAATARTALADAPSADVLAVERRATDTGFAVDVVCHDAGSGHTRSWWDSDTYTRHRISRRCLVDPDLARAHIRFEPALDYTLHQSPSGFRLSADFARGDYTLHIDAGTPTVDGGRFAKAHRGDVTIPARQPFVRFQTEGRYLPRSAWRRLPLRHLNTPTAQVTLRHVPPANLVFWLTGSDERTTDRTADHLAEVDIPLDAPADTPHTSWLDLQTVLPRPAPGVYEITVARGSARDVRRLLLSDLQLLVKRADPRPGEAWSRDAWAWVVDAHRGRPVAGATLRLVQPSGRAVATCRTSTNGACKLTVSDPPVAGTPAPFAVVARHGRDVTYLQFDEVRTRAPDAATYGAPYRRTSPYHVAAWTDRGVYRPGETAHLVAIARGTAHRAPPVGLPVTLVLRDPRGRSAKKLTGRTNAAGLVAFDLPFADHATTGAWDAALQIAERDVARHRFQVEAFVPERMKVTAAPTAAEVVAGAPIEVRVEARYLFGGSAADSQVKATCRLVPAASAPKPLAGYTISVADNAPTRDLGEVEATLDADGRATVSCPPTGALGAPADAHVQVAVLEAGSGRSTTAQATVRVHAAERYVALRTRATSAGPDRDLHVEGRVVDWRGVDVTDVAEVQVELVREAGMYGWFVDERTGNERWRRHLKPVLELSRSRPVRAGRFDLTVRPLRDGVRYVVRVRAGDARAELVLPGPQSDELADHAWRAPVSSRDYDHTPRPAAPRALRIQAPDQIRVGHRTEIRFDAPYRGRALVTVETDRVVRWDWLTVRPGANRWAFELERFAPNVYVGVLLLKDPHLESPATYVPDRAFGVRSLRVTPERFTRPVTLDVPDTVRPHQTLEVGIDVGRTRGPTFVTVAAVDQGILSLTGFASPDPNRDLFARRALGVGTFETVGWALRLGAQAPVSSGGGGDGEEEELGSSAARPVKPVALWSGIVEVPRSGKTTVRFEVPQYRGALRVMAVAAGPQRVGAASASVTVRDPLVLQTTLPRFLVGGDRAEVPVFLTNLSGADRQVTVGVTARALPRRGFEPPKTPPLEVDGEASRVVDLADGASARVVFHVTATAQTGGAELRVEARSGELVSHDSVEVPFRSATGTERTVTELKVGPGEHLDLAAHVGDWLDGTAQSTVWATTLPHASAMGHLRYLVQYPYGCVEQTTSSARPLLFVGDFLENIGPDLVTEGGIPKMIQAGIDRLLSMQTPSGGLAYWPGGHGPDPWGTAYATHFLLDARDAGHHVPTERLDDILDWIERTVDHNRARDSGPYLHFVLARAGRGRKAQVGRLVEGFGDSATEDAFLARAALYLSGDRRDADRLRRADTSAIDETRAHDGTYYSDRRRRGLELATRIDLFGADDPQAAALADVVGEAISGESARYNTQELMWGITGLGKYGRAQAAAAVPPTLQVDGRPGPPEPHDPKRSDRLWIVPRADERRGLEIVGAADAAGPVTVVLSTEGVPETPTARYGGEGLSLERVWLDPEGETLDAESIELGQLVYVQLTIQNTSDGPLQNLALVDRFPAGFEVENPRLGRGTLPAWVDPDELWTTEHLNIRDDRIELFGALPDGVSRDVVYAVRAVSAGSFQAPPVLAEAMYDPRVWARERGQAVHVRGPWGPLVD